MKIVVDIGHPSQVHFFKNFITEMRKRDHQVFITASEKEMTADLLQSLGFAFIHMGSYGKSLLQKIVHVPVMDLKMVKVLKKIQPDLVFGFGSVRAAHAAWLLHKPCVIFDGDDFTFPYYRWFADTICVFSGFYETGRKIVNVPGYKELSYLHPQWFTPAPADEVRKPVTVLRFVSRAFHDMGRDEFDLGFKKKLVSELEKYSSVFISSEAPLPAELEGFRIQIKPEEMHAFLSKASLLVTDSGSMTAEAAMLGVPAVRCNSYIGHGSVGVFREMEYRYDLVYSFTHTEPALQKAIELAQIYDIRTEWNKKRDRMLQEKIDVTSFMVWFAEQYPASVRLAKSYYTGS